MFLTTPITPAQLLGTTEQHIRLIDERVAIHQDMHSAFTSLKKAALADDIQIDIASGFRSFERQKMIWNNKFSGRSPVKNLAGKSINLSSLSDIDKASAILLFSALPGASRHHWGCDIDIYSQKLLPEQQTLQLEPWEYESTGPFAPLTAWLKEHARAFDFYYPYDKYRGGIAAEPWHLSFAPLSHAYEQAFQLDILIDCINHSNIEGGQMIINNLDFIVKTYISNVNEGEFTCL